MIKNNSQEMKEACDALRTFFEKQEQNRLQVQQNKSLEEKYLNESFIFDDEECVIADYDEWSFQEKRQDNFFNIYRHDVNNYIGMLEMLTDILSKGSSSEKHEEYRNILISILEKAELFLRGLTLLARDPVPSLHIIAELGKSKGNALQEIADRKNVELLFSNSEEQIFTDDAYLEVILRNIIENALKFVSGDGTGKVLIRTYSDTEDVFLQVQDNGVGMSEEQRKSLEKLFMGDDHSIHSTKGTRGEIGTGNGLRGCAKYTDLVGINVEIDSSEVEGNSGTIFTLKIPTTEKRYRELTDTVLSTEKEIQQEKGINDGPRNCLRTSKDGDTVKPAI